ncbi:Uncharacterised protein [BD1-7 clade bacterium]|uniref:Uncharacterized protein n=1 Tax=BD1-7 clade bacterium TaxID=2029982 RepID=A0A5S9PLP5_9GAMM|nr:Uncharacterised protein [BD1-7 clade bacterium]
MINHASPTFDVAVTQITLLDNPLSIHIDYQVADMQFHTHIKYRSIATWQAIHQKLDDAQVERMVALIAAWDAMRYLALGGTTVILPANYALPASDKAAWQHCFLNQFGEWRFKNRITYEKAYPLLQTCSLDTDNQKASKQVRAKNSKILLANGGGKDTLLGCVLLSHQSDCEYEFYHGFLPYGGCASTQQYLLEQLSSTFRPDKEPVSIDITDNYCNQGKDFFERHGVFVTDYHVDFSVGHTSNYVGYFPLLVEHGYEVMLFNIEKSADQPNCQWRGDDINHQWCKSTEYRDICTHLYHCLVENSSFKGFKSTIKGFYDTSIYQILSKYPEKLQLTHSCNIDKPWCKQCTKCCFCYLMMTAFCSEETAKNIMQLETSLFTDPNTQSTWQALLCPDQHAWECVASKAECHLACSICVDKGYSYPVLRKYLQQDVEHHIKHGMDTFAKIDASQFEYSLFHSLIPRFKTHDVINATEDTVSA